MHFDKNETEIERFPTNKLHITVFQESLESILKTNYLLAHVTSETRAVSTLRHLSVLKLTILTSFFERTNCISLLTACDIFLSKTTHQILHIKCNTNGTHYIIVCWAVTKFHIVLAHRIYIYTIPHIYAEGNQ